MHVCPCFVSGCSVISIIAETLEPICFVLHNYQTNLYCIVKIIVYSYLTAVKLTLFGEMPKCIDKTTNDIKNTPQRKRKLIVPNTMEMFGNHHYYY